MEGLILHEEGLGPHGIPLRVALDPDTNGWWEVYTREDNVQFALDLWNKENPDPPPGTRVFVRDTRKRE
jgi:hypothetical protein